MIANLASIDHSNQILWVIHNLERTADRLPISASGLCSSRLASCWRWTVLDDELETPANKLPLRIILAFTL